MDFAKKNSFFYLFVTLEINSSQKNVLHQKNFWWLPPKPIKMLTPKNLWVGCWRTPNWQVLGWILDYLILIYFPRLQTEQTVREGRKEGGWGRDNPARVQGTGPGGFTGLDDWTVCVSLVSLLLVSIDLFWIRTYKSVTVFEGPGDRDFPHLFESVGHTLYLIYLLGAI